MLLQKTWLLGWGTLVLMNIIALWDVSKDTCGYHYPILLSRALTTDPYRGITLGYCLLAIAVSFHLNSSGLAAAFLGFYSAFLVSMFETSAHNALIIVSSVLVLWECQPQHTTRWKVHWRMTMLLAIIWMCWLSYVQVFWTGLEAKCSWWYITEYFLFWSMYLLVYWRIPPGTTLHDQFRPQKLSGSTTEQFYTETLEEPLSF